VSKPTTYVLVVTDMSGSMSSLANEVRSGLNAYMDELRKSKTEKDLRYRVSVTVFDTEFIPLCVAAKLSDVPALDSKNYTPRGMTALLDAVGKTVAEFEAKVNLEADDRVLLVIQTDGQENSSQEFTWDTIRELLEKRTADARWTVVYLGQGVNAWDQGHRFGGSTQTVKSSHSAGSTRSVYTGLAAATVSYAADGTEDVGATIAAMPGVLED